MVGIDVSLAPQGLTSHEVRARVAAGQVNNVRDKGSRSLASIIRTNTLTWFNALIGTLWVAMMIVAPWQDALFGFVIVFNTLIGTIQEYRSARTLAALSLLNEFRPTVVRDGAPTTVGMRELVVDDVVLVTTGDQIAVDGDVLAATGLEVDESLLTGEADPVFKSVGDELMSGSFVVAGSAAYRVTRVGADSFAGRLTAQAKKFQTTDSELRDSINRFIRYISYALIPIGALLTYSQLQADQTLPEAIRGAIAGVVTMVPEGLVLLTSIAMAVGVVRSGETARLDPGPARRGDAGPGGCRVRRQDRHPDRSGDEPARGRAAVRGRRRTGARLARGGRGEPESDHARARPLLPGRPAGRRDRAVLVSPQVVGGATSGSAGG